MGRINNAMPKARARQAIQAARTAQGVASGELSKSERLDLREGRQEIRDAKQAARADGVVTKEERQGVQELLNEQSADIYEAKHNDERAGWRAFCGG